MDDHNEQTQAENSQQKSPIPDSPAVVGQTDPRVENQSAPESVAAPRDQEAAHAVREAEREQARQLPNERSSSDGPSPTSVATQAQSTDPVVDDSQDQA